MSASLLPVAFASLRGASVVVTGATGFVGGWLAVVLARAGARVSAWGRNRQDPDSPILLAGVDMVEARNVELTDPDQVRDALAATQPSLIVHLAAQTSVRQALAHPRDTFGANATGTLNLFEAARVLKPSPRIILSSSHMALPVNSELALDEDASPSFSDPYGTSKAVSELLARSYTESYWPSGRWLAVVRFANVVGFGPRCEERVVQRFAQAAQTSGRIELAYRLNGRQFLYMTDLIDGLLRVVGWLAAPGEQVPDANAASAVFHLALETYEGQSVPFMSMQALANLVASLTSARVDSAAAHDWAPGERRVQALSCRATRARLGWQPRISLTQGIRRVLDWYRAKSASPAEARARLAAMVHEDLDAMAGDA